MPSAATIEGLYADGVPREAVINNPLDVTGITANNPYILAQADTRFADDDNFDAVVITGQWAKNEAMEEMGKASLGPTLEAIRNSSKPLIPMNFLATEVNAYARDFADRTGYPHVADSYDRGVPAVAHAVWWGKRLRELAADEGSKPYITPVAKPVGAADWTEAELGEFLRTHHVPVVPAKLVGSATEAQEAAAALGFPVAIKVASPDITHKSDVGGVRLDLTKANEVAAAFVDVTENAAHAAPEARLRGATVSPMRSGGVELLVGVVRNPQWGPILALGLGGVMVEALDDTVLRRLPVGKPEIHRMLDQLKGAHLLHGFRGTPPVDTEALVDAVDAIARVAVGLGDHINALEVNPLVAYGDRVEALDVLVEWRG